MEDKVLNVEPRDERGSVQMGRLRKQGFIPGVVYGQGREPVAIRLQSSEYNYLASRSGRTQLYRLKSQEKKLDGVLALIKDVHVEPLKDSVLHVDFLSVDESGTIVVSVPVELTGESPIVKQGIASINHTLHEIEVECSLRNIPSSLVVDISGLSIGHPIHVVDVLVPEGVTIKTSMDIVVVSAVTKKAEEEEAKPAAAAEPEVIGETKPESEEEEKSED